jgi:hypothetical protein
MVLDYFNYNLIGTSIDNDRFWNTLLENLQYNKQEGYYLWFSRKRKFFANEKVHLYYKWNLSLVLKIRILAPQLYFFQLQSNKIDNERYEKTDENLE